MRDQRPDTVGQGADNISEVLETLDKRHGKARCYRSEVAALWGATEQPLNTFYYLIRLMFKWTCISIVLLQSTYRSKGCKTLVIFTHWWQRLPCKVRTAHQDKFRVQYLAQGYMRFKETSSLPITRRPALPPELQPNKWPKHFKKVQYLIVFCSVLVSINSWVNNL